MLFLKYPHPGRVKTRLAPALGRERAAGLYRRFVEFLLEELRRGGIDPMVCYDPASPEEDYRAWLGPGRYRPQAGGDLGARMAAALGEALARGADRAVLLGSDLPHLEARRVREAHAALDRAPVVLGPSRDGGYYLVGVRGSVPDLFQGVEWSTDRVLEQTLERARSLGIAPALLEVEFDVDDPEDLERLRALVPERPGLGVLLEEPGPPS